MTGDGYTNKNNKLLPGIGEIEPRQGAGTMAGFG
jgi:hypothetical protein